jgi:two-component system CheB/CheR fusion protein
VTSKKNPPKEKKASDDTTQSGEVEAQSGEVEAAAKPPLTIVGVGASAGGLEALNLFFSNLQPDSGAAYVVVTHQHAGHVSMMPELLSRHSDMPVREIESGTLVQANRVYVGPPGMYVAMLKGVLQLMPEESREALRMPIDYFFRSLAQDQGEHAVGIVLSGTGSDGSLGLKAIKGASGMSMAQAEDSARYPGMPRSAIATGKVDFVLPVEELPKQLLEYVAGTRSKRTVLVDDLPEGAGDLRRVMILLRQRTRHDFSNYKMTTIRRRIQRRMNLHGLEDLHDYVRFLQANQAEVDTLFQELLINVTSFFRDPEAFEVLAKEVLPAIVASKADDEVIRVWVPGCSTGEEAYSIAMLLRETMDKLRSHAPVQIFATDLDAEAVETARTARYPEGIVQDISPERLSRFFSRSEHSYQANKDLREMIIFAPQNLLQDPPFTKLDLLSCRNLLIYLDSSLQNRVLPIFHYSLRPKGFLFLGSSESVGSENPLFTPIDKRWKIFRRNEVPANTYSPGFTATVGRLGTSPGADPAENLRLGRRSVADAAQQAEHLLLRELVPPTVLCDARGDIVHIHGRTGEFLELAPGPQTGNNLFKMAREGLQLDLAAAVRQAVGSTEDVVHRNVRFQNNGDRLLTDLRVRYLQKPERYSDLTLVSFERVRKVTDDDKSESDQDKPSQDGNSQDRATELLRELQHTKEVHQGTVELLQTSNEELKSTNEELQSTNEELQSTNEELETSKEEMQSLNEELHTVNAELQAKFGELAEVNDDMRNLLNGTDIATIFVDSQLRIKRYTEQVKSIANLIPGDIGRPLSDLVSKLDYEGLIADAKEVLRTLLFREVEVQGSDNRWYQVRIVPYRTTENVIDGLVLTFVDITKVKALMEAKRKMSQLLKSSPVCLFGNDLELRYLWASEPGVLGHSMSEMVGKRDADFLSKDNAEALAVLKKKAVESRSAVRDLIELDVKGTVETFDLHVQPTMGGQGRMEGIACVLSAVEDAP